MIKKLDFWFYIQNAGDGSAYVRFFNSEADAEAYAENDDERYCDDICQESLEFDSKTGKLTNPTTLESHWKIEMKRFEEEVLKKKRKKSAKKEKA